MNTTKALTLHFEVPDENKFEALKIARQVLQSGGSCPAVFNAANEVAVQAFLERKTGFLNITKVCREVLQKHQPVASYNLEEILEIDRQSRQAAADIINNFKD